MITTGDWEVFTKMAEALGVPDSKTLWKKKILNVLLGKATPEQKQRTIDSYKEMTEMKWEFERPEGIEGGEGEDGAKEEETIVNEENYQLEGFLKDKLTKDQRIASQLTDLGLLHLTPDQVTHMHV